MGLRGVIIGEKIAGPLFIPAGHDKSAGFLAQISCEIAIHFIPNLACVVFTLRKVLFSNSIPPESPKNSIYNHLKYLFLPSDTIFDYTTGHMG